MCSAHAGFLFVGNPSSKLQMVVGFPTSLMLAAVVKVKMFVISANQRKFLACDWSVCLE